MNRAESIAVIGAGAWGTTLSTLLSENGHDVKLWVLEEDLSSEMVEIRENKRYLPGFPIPAKIEITSDLREAVSAAKLVILAVPSKHLREVTRKTNFLISKDMLILSVTKGLEENSHKRMSEVIIEELNIRPENLAVLSGPNLSKEIAMGAPAASVVASKSIDTAKKFQEILMMERFRIYTNTDVTGVELGGALKNIIAIAAGVVDGLKLGDNAKAGLMVRGITEITRLGVAMGAKESTFSGLSGIGDLIATCASKLSRNHFVGEEIAKGKKLDDTLKGMEAVAEGIPTTKAALALSKKYKIEMPITEQVHRVLFDGKDPYKAITDLMMRAPKEE